MKATPPALCICITNRLPSLGEPIMNTLWTKDRMLFSKYFTKVVKQMVQFLSDHRAGDALVAHIDLNDLNKEED